MGLGIHAYLFSRCRSTTLVNLMGQKGHLAEVVLIHEFQRKVFVGGQTQTSVFQKPASTYIFHPATAVVHAFQSHNKLMFSIVVIVPSFPSASPINASSPHLECPTLLLCPWLSWQRVLDKRVRLAVQLRPHHMFCKL